MKLNQITLEIYSRLLTYAKKYERDGKFIMQYLAGKSSYDELNDNEKDKYHFLMNDLKDNKHALRNYLAHYNLFLGEGSKNNTSYTVKSLMDAVNLTRELMSYDRKSRNVITNIIKDTLAKYRIEIDFSFRDNKSKSVILQSELEINSIKSARDEHLGFLKNKEPVYISSHSKEFIKQVRYLLTLEKK